MRLLIFGAGGMGRELADIAARDKSLEIRFVTDDGLLGELDHPRIDPTDIRADDHMVLAVGDGAARRALADRFSAVAAATIISDKAVVSPSAILGDGAVICDFALVNSRAVLGRHLQLNCFSQVSHDCVIGDFVTFAPRVSCNGWVSIGDGVTVGAGAIIRNGSPDRRLRIGEGAVIGMGAVVVEDVPNGATVMGVPARQVQAR